LAIGPVGSPAIFVLSGKPIDNRLQVANLPYIA